MTNILFKIIILNFAAASLLAGGGNRLYYLHEDHPYYPSHNFPRLATEQWTGDSQIQGVVILAVDDLMENSQHFENFLRPLINRLKSLYGSAPISIMSNRVKPDDPIIARWLSEGLNLDTHTHTHPCPLFDKSDFASANWTYHTCIDNLSKVPGNKPVAFRMPCLDIWNTTSPRFYSEIFNSVSPDHRFLTMSSSVTVVFNGIDPELPRRIVLDEEGRERFGKYMNQKDADVFGRVNYQYGNFVRNYPYPIVTSKLCWEIPMVTSDNTMAIYWGRYGNKTLRDWKAAIDATVIKHGTLALCFHTGGTSKPEEFVGLIDHVEKEHRGTVRFMNFREVQERIDKHFLGGHPLRASNGQDNGVRVLDLNNDGYLDVVIGNEKTRLTRVWQPDQKQWKQFEFPVDIVQVNTDGNRRDAGVRFGILQSNGKASFIIKNETVSGLWHFNENGWQKEPTGLAGFEVEGAFATVTNGIDQGVRLRDLDNDGQCELIWSNPDHRKIFRRSCCAWLPLPFELPEKTRLVNVNGSDGGLRFVDLNDDKMEDLIFSDETSTVIGWGGSMEKGWASVFSQLRATSAFQIPPIAKFGTNNGAWFDDTRMWMVNEDTSIFRDHAFTMSFSDINDFKEYTGGFQVLSDWLVVGPFDSTKESGFNTVFEPEKNVASPDPSTSFMVLDGRKATWELVKPASSYGMAGFSLEQFCLERNFRKNDLVVYLLTRVKSTKAQKAKLLLGSEDGVKVWVNGDLVHEKFIRRKARPAEDRVSLKLQEGENTIVVKLEQTGAGGWLLAALALSHGPVEVLTSSQNEASAK